jgi:hypothetical protein
MVVTWDGGLVIGRIGGGALSREDEDTVRVKIAKAG